jgi:hypothetical protein
MVDTCKQKRVIDDEDAHGIIKGLDYLYRELYSQYEELAQEDSMVKEKLFETGQDVAERKAIEIGKTLLTLGDSPEKVAKATGLPLRKVKALLKSTAKTKLPA